MNFCKNCQRWTGAKNCPICGKFTKDDYEGWTPCKIAMPECDAEIACLVTYIEFDFFESRWSDRKVGIMSCANCDGLKMWNTKSYIKVLAWKYMPKPWKGGD